MKKRSEYPYIIVGWREVVGLPELGVDAIKAKIDTGARTSALHADDVEFYKAKGVQMVRFVIHPKQRSNDSPIHAHARLADERRVRSSNGQQEVRPVIETNIRIGDFQWPIELTLTNRDVMGFRMLLGRQGVRGHALVNPGRSFLIGKPARKR